MLVWDFAVKIPICTLYSDKPQSWLTHDNYAKLLKYRYLVLFIISIVTPSIICSHHVKHSFKYVFFGSEPEINLGIEKETYHKLVN